MAPRSPAGTLDDLLSRRILFVAGKGGTGKSTVSAALALVAARRGKRVLCIEADAKGDAARSLGAQPAGFEPRVVRDGISVLSLVVEESMQEYLNLYFHVPRFTRLTPLARIFDFVATGVPGAKDMLVVGKIAYEEKRRDAAGAPVWDTIIVDSSATGHVLPQLRAARAMMDLVKGGIIRSQTEWIDATIADPKRTLLTICTLPEEMPVTEALELYARARAETRIRIGACWLNRTFPVAVTPRYVALAEKMAAPGVRDDVEGHLHGSMESLPPGLRLAHRLSESTVRHGRRLRQGMNVPVVEIPLHVTARSPLATTRAVASVLEEMG